MITVERTRTIAASPEAVFAVLADQNGLASLLPRVQHIDVLEQGDHSARLATHMSFSPFGSVRSEGVARWRDNEELVFETHKPVPVISRWTLAPVNGGTTVCATLSLDLAPLIGPLAAFVPPERVAGMIAPELDAALAGLAERVQA